MNDWVRVPENGKDESEDVAAPTMDAKQMSFSWRGGVERQTTGVWMWSEPFLRRLPGQERDVAVLLMDTQGMFDNETTMTLTAQIFGLSTLVSSYQVRLTPDTNWQHGCVSLTIVVNSVFYMPCTTRPMPFVFHSLETRVLSITWLLSTG